MSLVRTHLLGAWGLSLLLAATSAAPAAVTAVFSPDKDHFNAEHLPTHGNVRVTGLYGPPGQSFLDLASENESFTERILMQFDLSSIAGNGIQSATLRLFSRIAVAPTDDVDVFRLTAAFGHDDASWINRIQSTTTPWTTAGGDFANTQGAQAFNNPYASNKWVSGANDWDVKDLVQGWLSGSYANDGLLISKRLTQNHQQAFYYSSDHANPLERPTLTVVYPEPAALGPAVFGALFCFRRRLRR